MQWPPRNREGACSNAPIPKLTEASQNKSERAIAQVCARRPDLSHWQRKFLRSVSHRTRLSPTQKKIISRIAEQYLKEQTP